MSFAELGRETKTPMLWLYGDRDPFNTTSDIEGYARAFRAGGGDVQFVLYPKVPDNGHALPEHPELWQPAADAFLRARR